MREALVANTSALDNDQRRQLLFRRKKKDRDDLHA